MIKKGITFYEVLVYVAYGFYILLGLTWFIISFMSNGRFNVQAFFLIAVFAVQAWYRHILTNLILGVISLALSIFMLLQEIEAGNLFAKGASFDGLTKALIGFSFVSIVMSIILVFSYLKLSFKDQ
jgi:hypothetical protein